MKLVDLHVHSTCSDGTLTPGTGFTYQKTGLSAFGLPDRSRYGERLRKQWKPEKRRIEVLPGIEFSTEYKGKDIHIVGLEFDPESPVFLTEIRHFQDS